MSTQDLELPLSLLPAEKARSFLANFHWRRTQDGDTTVASYLAELLVRGMAADTLARELDSSDNEAELTPAQAFKRTLDLNEISRVILREMANNAGLLDELGEHIEVLAGIVGKEVGQLEDDLRDLSKS